MCNIIRHCFWNWKCIAFANFHWLRGILLSFSHLLICLLRNITFSRPAKSYSWKNNLHSINIPTQSIRSYTYTSQHHTHSKSLHHPHRKKSASTPHNLISPTKKKKEKKIPPKIIHAPEQTHKHSSCPNVRTRHKQSAAQPLNFIKQRRRAARADILRRVLRKNQPALLEISLYTCAPPPDTVYSAALAGWASCRRATRAALFLIRSARRAEFRVARARRISLCLPGNFLLFFSSSERKLAWEAFLM